MYQAGTFLSALAGSLLMLFGTASLGHGDRDPNRNASRPVSVGEKAFGRAGDPKKANRTVSVGMHDTMHFVATAGVRPAGKGDAVPPGRHAMAGDIIVKAGETVRFVVRNDGKVMHEMVIGTMDELKEHGELMRRFPDMEHDEPYMAHIAPGKSGELVWQFTKPGEFYYACLLPGHMEAGMISRITVVPSK